ncbi:hypothetical protein AX14_004712 [Amanita brunnescens Koide BX004]|nr:hypothetical protein AX14_004712 [Amanita brunnescens Koide BX004]
MSPGTVISPKSPKGFFRLEPIQSHSSSGEARLSLNHVADKDPFVAETKRPWVSRRKSRRAEPPWKKFVTVFRVAPQVPIPFESASSIEPESPTVQFGNFEMENQSMASSSSISSAASGDSALSPATFIIDNLEVSHSGTPQFVQSVKHEASFDFFGLADILLPFHQDFHRGVPNQSERRGY